MPTISVRNLPEGLHRALENRAAEHGRSTEAEVHAILAEALVPTEEVRLGTALRRRIGGAFRVPEDYDPVRSSEAERPARFE